MHPARIHPALALTDVVFGDQLFRAFDEVLSPRGRREFTSATNGTSAAAAPLNVAERDNSFFVEIEVPGATMEELDLSILGRQLTVKRTVAEEKSKTETNYLLRERREGQFTRTVQFPVDVDAAKVNASLKNGVLTIQLPKAESAQLRKIAVSAN